MYVKSKDFYLFFDRDRVIAETATAERKGLSRFGAYCRSVARNSIKNATEKKKVSKPGEPPLGHTGLLKKFIYFGWDGFNRTVVIGPMKLYNGEGNVPELLEYGGYGDKRFGSEGYYRARPYMRPALKKSIPYTESFFEDLF